MADLTDTEAQLADYWHGQGMSNAGVAGILGTASQEAPGGPESVNPTSGASGTYQYLGDRAEGERLYGQYTGRDPNDPQVQNEYANGEMRGQIGGSGLPNNFGDSMFHATSPDVAADQMVRGFERPGPEVVDAESQRAQSRAEGYMDALDARYGGGIGHSGGGPNVEAQLSQSDPDEAAAWAAYDQSQGPVGGGKFDSHPLPPTQRSPTADPEGDAWKAYDAAQQAQQPPAQPAGGGRASAPGYDWGSLGSALSELPRGIGRGLAAKIGLPSDLFNWMSDYYSTHPRDAALVGMAGEGGMAPGLGDVDNLPAYDPNGKGMHLPLTTQNIESAVKYVTGIDLNQQNQTIGGDTAGDIGEFIGAGFAPKQLAQQGLTTLTSPTALSATKSALGMLFHHVLAPAGISGGLDAGKWAVDKYSPNQGVADAIGIGARAALGGALLHSITKGTEAAKGFVEQGPQSAVNAAFTAAHGAEGADAAKAAALQNLQTQGYNADYGYQDVPGYQTPAALQTASAPLQQMFFDAQKNNMRMHNDFVVPGGQADQNISAMEGMRPEGDAADAVTAVRNMQTQRQMLIDQRVQQARDLADQAGQIATQGGAVTAGGGVGQTAGFNKAQAYVDELRAARDDAFTHADQQWQVARDQGFTTAQAPVDQMYPKLEALMGENIRLQQGANFPWGVVNDLYSDGNPQGMFDKLGTRDPATVGENQLFGPGTTLEQLKGLDSRLGNAIRMEQDAISSPGNRGNPQLLRNLSQVRDAVWGTIDDGATAAGNQVALRTAMDATSQAYRTFGSGILAKLLNERGGATNAPEILRSYLGNTQNAIQAASMFRSAMEQRTGAAAARLNGTASPLPGAAPQDQFMRTLGDWLRQDYLNTRSDLGPAAGQRWLTHHAGFFQALQGNPVLDNLGQELQGYSTVQDSLLPQVERQAQTDSQALNHNAASLFLGGDAGPRLDAVLRSQNPGAAMNSLIGDTRTDGSGRAFRGLQSMFFQRVMDEALQNDPLRPNQTFYSGKAAQQFLGDNKVAYSALRAADPGWGDRLDRMVRTMATEDSRRYETGLQLPAQAAPGKGYSAIGSLGTKIGQIIGTRIGLHLNGPEGGGFAGQMQAAGLASQYTKELISNGAIPGAKLLTNGLNKVDPMSRVRLALAEALQDPEKLRGLLAPVTGPSGQKWAAGIEPWLQATGVEMPQGWLNPPPGPEQNQEPGINVSVAR